MDEMVKISEIEEFFDNQILVQKTMADSTKKKQQRSNHEYCRAYLSVAKLTLLNNLGEK